VTLKSTSAEPALNNSL